MDGGVAGLGPAGKPGDCQVCLYAPGLQHQDGPVGRRLQQPVPDFEVGFHRGDDPDHRGAHHRRAGEGKSSHDAIWWWDGLLEGWVEGIALGPKANKKSWVETPQWGVSFTPTCAQAAPQR
jgi:hypothetical protein